MLEGRDAKKSLNLVELLFLLKEDEPVHANILAQKLGVSKRTIARYIDDLIYLGISIESTPRGYKLSDDTAKIITEKIKKISLFDLLSIILSPEYQKERREFLRKGKSLFSRIKRYFVNLDFKFLIGKEEVISIILEAISKNRKIEIQYHSLNPSSPLSRVVHPFALISKWGALYLLGYCEFRKEVRHFRIDRMVSVKQLEENFELLDDSKIKNYLDNIFLTFHGKNTVKLKAVISEKLKIFLEHTPISDDQKLYYDESGRIVLEFTTTSEEELIRWLMWWQEEIRVVEPQYVIDKLKFKLNEILNMY